MRPERNQNHAQEYADQLEQRFAEGVLAEMQAYPHFVVWRYTELDGKIKKPPYNPHTGTLATPIDPQTWGTLEQALAALKTGQYNGLGFVFSEDDPFTGTDLDHCVTPQRTLVGWAQEIVTQLDSYTELSPSKQGVHIITKAALPGTGRKVGNVEMYSAERYFTLTTLHLPDTSVTIEDRQHELEALYARYTPPEKPHKTISTTVFTLVRPDYEVLEKAEGAKNGQSFRQLYQGNTAGFRSKSEADFTLVLRLLYWTNDDVEQTKRLFRQSGLYDPEKTERKTGEHTYLDMTVYNALRKRNT